METNMRTDRLTSKFQLALSDAQSLANGRDHQFIEPVHLMLAMLNQEGGTVRHLLAQSGADVNQLRSSLGETFERLPQVEGTDGDIHISNELSKILNVTDKLAQQRSDQFISSELFVLAAIDSKGVLGEILRKTGQTETSVLRDHLLLTGLAKLSRYEAECAIFTQKHGSSLVEFKDRVIQKPYQEIFTEEDDLMDWEFADAALKWWQAQIEELRSAA